MEEEQFTRQEFEAAQSEYWRRWRANPGEFASDETCAAKTPEELAKGQADIVFGIIDEQRAARAQ